VVGDPIGDVEVGEGLDNAIFLSERSVKEGCSLSEYTNALQSPTLDHTNT